MLHTTLCVWYFGLLYAIQAGITGWWAILVRFRNEWNAAAGSSDEVVFGTLAVLGLIGHHVHAYTTVRWHSTGRQYLGIRRRCHAWSNWQPRTVSSVHERRYRSLLRNSEGLRWPRSAHAHHWPGVLPDTAHI
jgi:hypothetical protein